MTTIAVFGGAFNPPHVGHMMIVSWVQATGLADAVWFVPSFAHPFPKAMAPFETRVQMCLAMARHVPGAKVSAIEATLTQPNFTIRTLEALATAYPVHRFRLVLGLDNYLLRARWHRYPDIERNFSPIVVVRKGVEPPLERDLRSPEFPQISATYVRETVKAGLPYDHLVPVGVAQIIRTERLYEQVMAA